jgi:1-acyl-sn-glycerol-3-phosphate acyltransferase
LGAVGQLERRTTEQGASGERVDLLSNAVMWPWFLAVSLVTLAFGVLAAAARPWDRARLGALWVHHWLWGRALFALGPLWRVQREIATPLGPGPYVVVSTHASLIDIPLNLGLPLPIRVSARPGIFRVPLMGAYMRFSRMIPVASDSRESVEASLEACRAAIRDGASILVFPEGTRSVDGRIGPFHKGAFVLARELGVPILPVVIDGSMAALPKGSPGLVQRFCGFRLRAMAPIEPDAPSRVLARRVREAMVAELARMRAELPEAQVHAGTDQEPMEPAA